MTEVIREALASVHEPMTGQPLSTLSWITFADSAVYLAWPYAAASLWPSVTEQLQALLPQHEIKHRLQIKTRDAQQGISPVPGIKNIISVASGKGGVGKSTVTANLARALQAEGARVGVLDADIYGPSQPLLLGADSHAPLLGDDKKMQPIDCGGIATMSVGYLLENPETATIWRGPMVSGALIQMFQDTRWGELDYLLIDLPPGTGDIQLTLSQKIPVTGAVIVTTPQDIALLDARKAYTFFRKTGIEVLGVIENMSVHQCEKCGHASAIFGTGGGARMARQYGMKLLGELPLDRHLREASDMGQAHYGAFISIAHEIGAALAQKPENHAHKFGKIVVQHSSEGKK